MTEEEGAALDIKFQQRFSKNLISNVVYFVLNVIIGLALVPFFLDTLGPAAYALVPLATSITSYVTLIIQCLNMSVSRFLTIDLQRGDIAKAKETFNTALFGTLIVILLLVPVALGIAWVTPYFFSIGEESTITVFILFSLVFLSAFIRAWSSNFMVTLFAHNRLDLWNWVNASYLIVQVISVVLFFIIFSPSLELIGISYLIAAIFSSILAIVYSNRVNPLLKIKLSLVSKPLFWKMSTMSGWLIFVELGTLLQLPVGLIIANLLFGEVAETQYSLVITFVTLLLGISGLITSTFRPMIYSYVSNNDTNGVANFLTSTIRIVGLTMALPTSLICIFAPQLLTLWVGEEYAILSPLVWILVLPTITNVIRGCIGPLCVACNRVKVIAIANFLLALVNIGLAFILSSHFDIGIYGIGIAWAVSNLMIFIFIFIYSAYILNIALLTFLNTSIIVIISVLILFGTGIITITIIPINSIAWALILGGIICVIYYVILTKIIFKRDEIKKIRACLPKFLERKIPKWLF